MRRSVHYEQPWPEHETSSLGFGYALAKNTFRCRAHDDVPIAMG